MNRRPRTAQIKPATRDALKDQLALAADEIIRLRHTVDWYERLWLPRPWWHRLMWWRK